MKKYSVRATLVIAAVMLAAGVTSLCMAEDDGVVDLGISWTKYTPLDVDITLHWDNWFPNKPTMKWIKPNVGVVYFEPGPMNARIYSPYLSYHKPRDVRVTPRDGWTASFGFTMKIPRAERQRREPWRYGRPNKGQEPNRAAVTQSNLGCCTKRDILISGVDMAYRQLKAGNVRGAMNTLLERARDAGYELD